MTFDLTEVTNFINSIDLSGIPRGILSQGDAAETTEIFDKAKVQAQIVGSGVFSFATGVDADVREAISDSALLAQLVANKRAKQEENPLEWFNIYATVLANIGWAIQEGAWSDYTTRGTATEVNEKIVEVMTMVLGSAPTALAIIGSTVGALKAMSPNSPWLTIFTREAQHAKLARFQIGLVNKDENGDVFISLLACLIEADHTITQVLFFSLKNSFASFKANSQKISINRSALHDLGPTIRIKVRAYQKDYLSSILNI